MVGDGLFPPPLDDTRILMTICSDWRAGMERQRHGAVKIGFEAYV
jgi:hypothetical protein